MHPTAAIVASYLSTIESEDDEESECLHCILRIMG